MLRLLRRRSLAALRREIEPVPPATLAAFLPRWQQVGSSARGVEAVAAALEQLQGVAIPASAWESLVLPARVADYSPAFLDEFCASGEVVWAGSGSIPGGDGWICFAWAETAPLLLPAADPDFAAGPLHQAVLEALAGGQALFFRQLTDLLRPSRPAWRTEADLLAALWDLVWAGLVSNDTLAPVRALLAGGGATRPSRPRRVAVPHPAPPAREPAEPLVAGRRPLGPPIPGRALVPAARPRPQPDPARHRS